MRSLRVAIGFARLALGCALAATAGCSLVSGWSDLQGGALSTSDAGALADAGGSSDGAPGAASDSGAHGDASGGEDAGDSDASSVLLTVACGTSRCPLGEGCCAMLGISPAATCVADAQSCSTPNAFETCSDSSQCVVMLGHAAQCCDNGNGGLPGVACRTSCGGNGNVVCDPTLLQPTCPTGTTCKENLGFD